MIQAIKISSVGNIAGTTQLDYQDLPVIISRFTPRSHKKEPEYCLLSEKQEPAWKNSQQM
jgi:hypothetical protein